MYYFSSLEDKARKANLKTIVAKENLLKSALLDEDSDDDEHKKQHQKDRKDKLQI
jgi:hypothetical protein